MDSQNKNSDDTSSDGSVVPPSLPEPIGTPEVSESSQPSSESPTSDSTEQPIYQSSPQGDSTSEASVKSPDEPDHNQELVWSAAEFVAHSKTSSWYLALAVITMAVAALGYLITRDIVTIIVIIICGGLFGYTASRQPRQMEYSLDAKGIKVGPKFYPYTDFNAFSVLEQATFSSIDLMPLKHFAPILSVSYDPTIEPAILATLSQHLPYANHKPTMIDNLMHRIGF